MTLTACLTEIDGLKARLAALRDLDNYRLREALRLEYTYESNRIEGNTLTLKETDLVINEGLTIGGKPLRDHLEAINHRDALGFVEELARQDTLFRERDLLSIHNLILRGIDPDNAGQYRRVPVLIKGSPFVPPQPWAVPQEMEAIFRWYEAEGVRLHPVLLAAELHERIVTVHPFIDGNGRTARLVMNLFLLRHGYGLAILKGDAASRLRYYDALEKAQVQGGKEDFLLLVCETVRGEWKG